MYCFGLGLFANDSKKATCYFSVARRNGLCDCAISIFFYLALVAFLFQTALLSAKFVVATQHGMRDVLANVRLRGKPSGK